MSDLTLAAAREEVKNNWKWCQGWSPREGAFGRPMPYLGYSGETQYDLAGGACVAARMHQDSGCKRVTSRPLSQSQIEAVAHKLLAARQAKH